MNDVELMDLARRYCNRAEVPQELSVRAAIKALFRRNDFFGGLVSTGRAQVSVDEANGRFVYTWPD